MNRLEQYIHQLKIIIAMWYIIGGLILAIGGFIFGYLFCYRNPPASLKSKILAKLTGNAQKG